MRVHDWNQVVAYSVRTPNRAHVADGQYLYCTSATPSWSVSGGVRLRISVNSGGLGGAPRVGGTTRRLPPAPAGSHRDRRSLCPGPCYTALPPAERLYSRNRKKFPRRRGALRASTNDLTTRSCSRYQDREPLDIYLIVRLPWHSETFTRCCVQQGRKLACLSVA